MNIPFVARPAPRERHRWDEPRRDTLRKLWADLEVTVDEIADQLKTSRGAIYTKAHEMQLGRRPEGARRSYSGGRRKKRARPADRTRQRRHSGVASGDRGTRVKLMPWHPALRGSTLFPGTVMPAGLADRLIKDGKDNCKIGDTITKGRWAGMPIKLLTLEERATCPRSCKEWATCYGNNMNWAHRIAPDETLTTRLAGELAHLSALHPGGFVLRLHVLGDFFSVDYVEFWRRSLAAYPALRIFGFTAHVPPDTIGVAVGLMMRDNLDRVIIRFSGGGAESHCSEVVDSAEDATGVRCPAETDADRSCATCGLCMNSDVNISFVRH